MENFVTSVLLFYTLIVFGFLVFAIFNFRTQPNRYLTVGFLTICFHAVYKLTWLAWADHNQYELPIPLGLAYPLLLYLFAHSYYLPDRTISIRRASLLFSPLMIHLFLFFIASRQAVGSGWASAYVTIYYASCLLSLLVFATLTARLYHCYKGPLTAADILIRQLTMLCYGLVVLAYIVLYEVNVAESEIGFEVRPAVYLFMIIGCALILRYRVVQHIQVPSNANRKNTDGYGYDPKNPKPETLTSAALLAEVVESELHRSKLFLNPDLSLDILAQQTSIPRHQLTQIFRLHYQKSFYQFIAEMRIEYAISRVSEMTDTVTLDSLSYACGFNSKTSFNRYFKVYTGMTPSEYRSAHRSVYNQAVSVSS